MLQNSVVST